MMSYPLLCVASRHNVLVIGGDKNVKIGNNVNLIYSLQNSSIEMDNI